MIKKNALLALISSGLVLSCYVGFANTPHKIVNYDSLIKNSLFNYSSFNAVIFNKENVNNKFIFLQTTPLPPTADINAEGTEVSGKAQPGSTVEVQNQMGSTLGIEIAKQDGSYVITLNIPQKNAEELIVTATDAGGTSQPTHVTAPDLTPPDAPTANINSNGTIVSGIAQPGSTVEVKDSFGYPLGSVVTNINGQFLINLNVPKGMGEPLYITATDAGGTSITTTIYAPYMIQANDDVIRADIDLLTLVSNFTQNTVGGKLPAYNGITVDNNKVNMEVNFSNEMENEIQIKSYFDTNKPLNQIIRYYLYKETTNNNWQLLADNTNSNNIGSYFINTPNTGVLLSKKNFDKGNFKIIAYYISDNSQLLKRDINVKMVIQKEGYKTNSVTGNVLADDVTTSGTVINKIVNSLGAYDMVPSTGSASLNGNYGTIVIKADGSYLYTPNAQRSVIGQVDIFYYTIKDMSGSTSTATIYVQIGCDEVSLSWNPQDPSKPATIN